MCLLLSLLPATFWVVLAYVVFFLANRSEGTRKALGRVLGIWLIGLTACFLIFGAFVQFVGTCPVQRGIVTMLTGERPVPVYPVQTPGAARRSF